VIRDESAKIQGYIADGTIKPVQAHPEIVRIVYPANNPVRIVRGGQLASNWSALFHAI
jgi:hypothetical protein